MSALPVGYARVSTHDQDLTAQRNGLATLGVSDDRTYVDHRLTGTNRERPGLREALAACRSGDTLVVTKLDRLARSLPDAREILEDLTRREVKPAPPSTARSSATLDAASRTARRETPHRSSQTRTATSSAPLALVRMRFQDVKPRFWDLSVSHEVLAPLTDADVRRAENALGYRLPAAYVELLGVQNGGYVSREFDAFPSPEPTSWANDHVWLRTMMGIGAPDEFGSILQSPALNTEWGMPPQLVLLSGDGHFWIALDYRSTLSAAEPSVVWIDNEVHEDLQLAHNFVAFVEGLVPMDSFAD